MKSNIKCKRFPQVTCGPGRQAGATPAVATTGSVDLHTGATCMYTNPCCTVFVPRHIVPYWCPPDIILEVTHVALVRSRLGSLTNPVEDVNCWSSCLVVHVWLSLLQGEVWFVIIWFIGTFMYNVCLYDGMISICIDMVSLFRMVWCQCLKI